MALNIQHARIVAASEAHPDATAAVRAAAGDVGAGHAAKVAILLDGGDPADRMVPQEGPIFSTDETLSWLVDAFADEGVDAMAGSARAFFGRLVERAQEFIGGSMEAINDQHQWVLDQLADHPRMAELIRRAFPAEWSDADRATGQGLLEGQYDPQRFSAQQGGDVIKVLDWLTRAIEQATGDRYDSGLFDWAADRIQTQQDRTFDVAEIWASTPGEIADAASDLAGAVEESARTFRTITRIAAVGGTVAVVGGTAAAWRAGWLDDWLGG